jgi:hypothetical protein
MLNSDYINLLCDFNALPQTLPNTTIFEVGGFPHYEDAISNILAFYLDPQREHGMGTLLLDSILKLAGQERLDRLTDIEVPEREFQTEAGGYLDLLVKTSVHVIGIENKINAPVKNDLNDYWATLKTEAAAKPIRNPVGIVLSIRKRPGLPGEWQNITYSQLWQDVKSQLGHRIQKADSKWLQYFMPIRLLPDPVLDLVLRAAADSPAW